MSGMYALRYPERVKKLLLLSPAGVSRAVEDPDREATLAKQNWFRRQMMKMAMSAIENKLTPHKMAEKVGILKTPLLKNYVKRTKVSGEQYQLIYKYLNGIFKLPESTLKSLHYILAFPKAAGCYPLEDLMHELKMPCEIYYGEKDWMSSEGSQRVVAKGGIDGKITIIPTAGHTMNFDNPKFTSDLLISHKLKEEKLSVEDLSGSKIVKNEITLIPKFESENEAILVQG